MPSVTRKYANLARTLYSPRVHWRVQGRNSTIPFVLSQVVLYPFDGLLFGMSRFLLRLDASRRARAVHTESPFPCEAIPSQVGIDVLFPEAHQAVADGLSFRQCRCVEKLFARFYRIDFILSHLISNLQVQGYTPFGSAPPAPPRAAPSLIGY